MTNIDRYKSDLKILESNGRALFESLNDNEDAAGKFFHGYQAWYTEALEVVRQITPSRFTEFCELYEGPKRKVINGQTYSIKDWLLGIRAGDDVYNGGKLYPDHSIVSMRFNNQYKLLMSASKRFESSLFDIKQLVQADIIDSELDKAEVLNARGFQRGAGAIVGVVIESHLSQVCDNHAIKVNQKNPTINDFADLLKKEGVIEIPEWRKVQHLADLRNLCDHKKDQDPTKEQITDLIEGSKKLVKTLF